MIVSHLHYRMQPSTTTSVFTQQNVAYVQQVRVCILHVKMILTVYLQPIYATPMITQSKVVSQDPMGSAQASYPPMMTMTVPGMYPPMPQNPNVMQRPQMSAQAQYPTISQIQGAAQNFLANHPHINQYAMPQVQQLNPNALLPMNYPQQQVPQPVPDNR